MLCSEYAQKRLRAILAQIAHLLGSEFPYGQSRKALKDLGSLFVQKLRYVRELEALKASTEEEGDSQFVESVIKERCIDALSATLAYLPILGFLLRSTNVRNAFEAYWPLRRLARDILEPGVSEEERKTELILSSEWDYSPLVYPKIRDLPSFVLVGLPAHDSENPLLLPLAGHELGHSVWAKREWYKKKNPFTSPIGDAIVDAIWSDFESFRNVFPLVAQKVKSKHQLEHLDIAKDTWRQAASWAMNQAEETLCDFIGLRIFGRSYLRAFAYLLAPKHRGQRSASYPSMRTRVTNLLQAARKASYDVEVPEDYKELFADEDEPKFDDAGTYRLKLADAALSAIVDKLIDEADSTVSAANIAPSAKTEVEEILVSLNRVVPAEDAKTLADILNAAWVASENPTLWEDVPQLRGRRKKKERTLREVVLKNIEVLEFKQILKERK